MTRLGKVLVFLNLTLALVFAAWALAVYTQRVDWLDRKKDQADERSWGRIAVLKDDIARVNGSGDRPGPRGLAELRWLSALAEVRAAEAQRLANQQWYAAQLADLENGQADPVKRVVYQKGEVVVQKGLPLLEVVKDQGGAPLKAHTELVAEQAKLNTALAQEQAQIAALAEEARKQTEAVLELFKQIERTTQARQASEEEQRYLEQILYNVQVEAELLQARQVELEARLTELKASAARP